MEILFKQSFNYATIKVFKNYSDRLTRNLKPETIEVYGNPEEIDPFQEPVRKFTVTAMSKPLSNDLRLYMKGKKKTNFFYTTQPNKSFTNHALPNNPVVEYENIELINPATILQKSGKYFFETTKDRHIKAFYNNPFASIEVHKIERWIKKDGDKIIMKMFMQSRNRNINSIYFAKSTSSTTIVFDLRKGNFRIVTFQSGRKSRIKHFYCNSFNALKTSLPIFYNIKESFISKSSSVYKEYVETFDTIQFQFSIKSALGLEDIFFGATSEILSSNFVNRWMPRFIEIKKIKVPDKGERLLKWYYPTEKYLKKNDNKLVAAVLDRFGLKSKITIKLLHKYSTIDIIGLSQLSQLFGMEYPKYIGNINEGFFANNSVQEHDDQSGKSILLDVERRRIWDIYDSEKESIINIINDAYGKNPDAVNRMHMSTRGLVATFIDHFQMIEKLKPYFPDMRLNAKRWETFNAEHSLYAKYEREVKRGYTTEVIFDTPVLQEIEKPIEVFELDKVEPIQYFENVRDRIAWEKQIDNAPSHAIQRIFEPKLLRSSDDYFEEGGYMSHCVAGYLSGVDHSIIVSIRLGLERVTCEYLVKDRSRQQAKYFHNQKPPDYYERALEIMDKRIKSIPFPIKPLDTKQIPLVINGVKVKIELNPPVEAAPLFDQIFPINNIF